MSDNEGGFGRFTLLAMIPINLFIVPWAWFGRLIFGVFGWFGFIMAPLIAILAIALLVTTILAFTLPTRPRRLGGVQTTFQWLTWLAFLVFGAFMPDFGDTDDSHISLLTQLFGHSDALLDLSYSIAFIAGGLGVVALLGLFISLLVGRGPAADAAS